MADDSLLDWILSVGTKHGFSSGGDAREGAGGKRLSPEEKRRMLDDMAQMDKELDELLAAATA